MHDAAIGVSGLLLGKLVVPADEWDRVKVTADDVWWEVGEDGKRRLCFAHRNGYVNLGLVTIAARFFGLVFGTGVPAACSHMGISSDATVVTRTTLFLGGAAAAILAGATQNGQIKAISPATTIAGTPGTNVAIVSTSDATFTEADMAGARFIINKVGLLNAATDVGSSANASGVQDIVGGTGGVAPYAEPFSIDLRNATTFSQTLRLQTTWAAI